MSLSYLEIKYPYGGIALIGAVPRSKIVALEIMLRYLYDRWIEKGLATNDLLDDTGCWQMMTRIANCFPRLDVADKMGFDLSSLKSDPDQLEALFLAQCQPDESLIPAKLVELNCFEPLPVPAWRISEDTEPTPSSGDPDMDLMAMLTVSSNAQDAAFLMDRLNTQQLDRYLFYLAELRRDPEDRTKEALSDDYLTWKNENKETVREALGIQFQFPQKEATIAA